MNYIRAGDIYFWSMMMSIERSISCYRKGVIRKDITSTKTNMQNLK
ncbi:MAG: hypothetical protein Hyperionvirus6_77 [Hyperionvirus sp.]|uniref:Uncharacterized protein n=1 Tax=Hyperionvirus sp. TaxID=2487770 RepID=A0A3G5A801_9VIRU|nr:MAG: hypothetical protein Hyperionvirus6_77 [Hyperionvirus sp.]